MKWYRQAGYEGPAVISNYFKKRKTGKRINFLSSYNKRWFVLDFDQAILTYENISGKRNNKSPNYIVPFKDIIRIESEPTKDQLRLTTSFKKLNLLK